MTLQDAIAKNRQRDIRIQQQQAAKFIARANYFRKQAKDIQRNAAAYLDAAEEVQFQLGNAEVFDRRASESLAHAARLQALLSQEVSGN